VHKKIKTNRFTERKTETRGDSKIVERRIEISQWRIGPNPKPVALRIDLNENPPCPQGGQQGSQQRTMLGGLRAGLSGSGSASAPGWSAAGLRAASTWAAPECVAARRFSARTSGYVRTPSDVNGDCDGEGRFSGGNHLLRRGKPRRSFSFSNFFLLSFFI
jgi:hypothetical protein